MNMTAIDLMDRVLKYSRDTPVTKQIADLYTDCSDTFKADKVGDFLRCGFVTWFMNLGGELKAKYIRNTFDSVGQVAMDTTAIKSISEYAEDDPIRQQIDHGGVDD